MSSIVPWATTPPLAHAATPRLIDIEEVAPEAYPLKGVAADAELRGLAVLAAAQPDLGGRGSVQRVEATGWWLDTEQLADKASSDLVPSTCSASGFLGSW